MAPNGGDLIMSLMLAASVRLARHLTDVSPAPRLLTRELDRLALDSGILEEYLRLYQLDVNPGAGRAQGRPDPPTDPLALPTPRRSIFGATAG